MELLYSAGDGATTIVSTRYWALRDVPITRSVTNIALAALRRLAHIPPFSQRRIKFPDLLIAAAAQDGAVGVLHYDAHFDLLAEVLEFESRWIAPRGSL